MRAQSPVGQLTKPLPAAGPRPSKQFKSPRLASNRQVPKGEAIHQTQGHAQRATLGLAKSPMHTFRQVLPHAQLQSKLANALPPGGAAAANTQGGY
jgi:hypothetical protein